MSENYSRPSPPALQDTRIKNLITNFQRAQPGVTGKDIQQFIQFISLIPEDERYSRHLECHAASSLPNKIILLTMLDKPLASLDADEIQKTRNQLGFESIRALFLEIIESDLMNYDRPFTMSPDEADFLKDLSRQIKCAATPDDLEKIHNNLRKSPYLCEFGSGYGPSVAVLDFLVFGSMNENIHEHLSRYCSRVRNFSGAVISPQNQILADLQHALHSSQENGNVNRP